MHPTVQTRYPSFMRNLMAVALALIASCGPESRQPPGPVVRDSAGITIVENTLSPALDTMSWRPDMAGIVRIGSVDGAGPDVFGRMAGVARLSDGRIVVADALAAEIRFFDATGRFLSRTGRQGTGPGEYQFFSGLHRMPGDSLLVIDGEGSRLTVLAPDGGYVRTFRFQSNTGEVPRSDPPGVKGVFDDGSLLIGAYLNACSEVRRTGGVCQDSMRYTRDTEAGDRLADFGAQAYYRDEMIRLPNGRNYGFSDPYPQAFRATHGDRLHVADAERFEILTYGPDGRLVRIVRLAHEREPVPAAMRQPPPRPPGGSAETERRRNEEIAQAFALRTWPDRLPAFRSFTTDRAGNLWVMEYVTAGETPVLPRWLVFDSTGVLRRAVRLPPIMIVPPFVFDWRGEIGDDYVLGIARDSNGVESVWVVPLRKSVEEITS